MAELHEIASLDITWAWSPLIPFKSIIWPNQKDNRKIIRKITEEAGNEVCRKMAHVLFFAFISILQGQKEYSTNPLCSLQSVEYRACWLLRIFTVWVCMRLCAFSLTEWDISWSCVKTPPTLPPLPWLCGKTLLCSILWKEMGGQAHWWIHWKVSPKSSVNLLAFKVVLAVAQLPSPIWLFAIPWTAARQASLSFTISQSLLKLMCIELVMLSNRLILCCPLLLLPSIFPSIRAFSNELVLPIRWPRSWSCSFHMSPPTGYSSFRAALTCTLALVAPMSWFWICLAPAACGTGFPVIWSPVSSSLEAVCLPAVLGELRFPDSLQQETSLSHSQPCS